jgi:hypothetical protein
MAKIPYYFETPIPTYFRENGFFEKENAFKFIVWAFSKCSPEPRKVMMLGKEITLEPFEFIAGRRTAHKECFLTEKQWRCLLHSFTKHAVLKKTANSRANKFSCYVWLVEKFTKQDRYEKGQQMGQQRANRGPTKGHNLEDKKRRLKEDHPSVPSNGDGLMTDDFSSEKIDMGSGVFMSREQLEACVKIRGDVERVKQAVAFIMNSPRRKTEITDWPNAIARWKIEDKAKVSIEKNIALAERLCSQFHDFSQGNGWQCRLYTDRQKDQKGILFECSNPHQQAIFIALVDGEFEKKCRQAVGEKIAGKK